MADQVFIKTEKVYDFYNYTNLLGRFKYQLKNILEKAIHMSYIMTKPINAIYEQQRCRSTWASAQSDLCLYYSLPGYRLLTVAISIFPRLLPASADEQAI